MAGAQRAEGVGTSATLRVVPYDERFLDASWHWFQDTELQHQLDVQPVSREDQRAWFDSLSNRTDYFLWGVEYGGAPVAVFGIKNLSEAGCAQGHFFIGDKQHRGIGIGDFLEMAICDKARELGARVLYGVVVEGNEAVLHLHRKHGFSIGETVDGRINVAKAL